MESHVCSSFAKVGDGGIGGRGRYGELVSEVGTLNPSVVEELEAAFKPFYREAVELGGLSIDSEARLFGFQFCLLLLNSSLTLGK